MGSWFQDDPDDADQADDHDRDVDQEHRPPIAARRPRGPPGCSSRMPPSTGPQPNGDGTAHGTGPLRRWRGRARAAGKTTVMIASVTGSTAALPMPMMPRNAIKAPRWWARTRRPPSEPEDRQAGDERRL